MKVINLITIVGLALLALVPKIESLWIGAPAEPRPLCASQYALANYACAKLPYIPGTPPSPLTPPPPPPSQDDDDDDDSNRQRHGHGHGRGHGHRHRHHTSQEDDCCRWVKEVDSQCVCEVLLRLPPFLVKPAHQYTVTVGDSCNVTYSCGGPI